MKSKIVMFVSGMMTLSIGLGFIGIVALAASGFSQPSLAQIINRLTGRTTLPLAAIQDGDIWLFGLSDAPQPITNGASLFFGSSLTWSPDGEHLAFTMLDPDGGSTLTLSNRLGAAPVSLVSGLNTGLPINFNTRSDMLLYAVDSGDRVPESIGGEILVNAYTIALSPEAEPVQVGSFNFATCGGGGPQPYDALYWIEAGTLGNGLIFSLTPFGIVHSISCDGIGVALLNLDTGEDILLDPELNRAKLSADRTQLVGVRNGALTLVDLETQTVSGLDTEAQIDQVAWGVAGTGDLFYSSRIDTGEVVTTTEADRQELAEILGYDVAADVVLRQVAIYLVNTETGAETELYRENAYAVGRMTVTPDNQSLVFSQIPSIEEWYRGLLTGNIDATAPQNGRPFFGGLETTLVGLNLVDRTVETLDTGLNEFMLNSAAYLQLNELQPKMSLNPTAGRANTQVVVQGQGFPANTRLTLFLGQTVSDLDANPYAAGFTDQDGNISLVFNMPGVREDGSQLVSGPVLMLLSTADRTYSAQANFNFNAEAPAAAMPYISLSPISGTVGTQVNVNGRGFPSNMRINLHLGPANVGVTRDVYASAFSDSAGNVSLTFNLPAQYADGRPIQDTLLLIQAATDDLRATASLTFAYTPMVAQPVVLPAISLSPTSGRANAQITVRGRDFPAFTGVNILMGPSSGDLRGTYSAVTTDGGGGFETRFVLPARWPDGRQIPAGKLTIVALATNGMTTASAEFGFTSPSTPRPTATLTATPTTEPVDTVEPTEEPTVEPTSEPTEGPTIEPTIEPTDIPETDPDLQVDPNTGGADTLVMITAQGLPANTTVTLILTNSVGQQIDVTESLQTNDIGGFEVTYSIPNTWPDGTSIEPDLLNFVATTEDGSVITAPFSFVAIE